MKTKTRLIEASLKMAKVVGEAPPRSDVAAFKKWLDRFRVVFHNLEVSSVFHVIALKKKKGENK